MKFEDEIKNIDLTKYSKKKDMDVFLTLPEKAIVRWLDQNGFVGKLITANINKIAFLVTRDGVSDTLEVSSTRKSDTFSAIEYCEQFERSFNLKCENERLRNILRSRLADGTEW